MFEKTSKYFEKFEMSNHPHAIEKEPVVAEALSACETEFGLPRFREADRFADLGAGRFFKAFAFGRTNEKSDFREAVFFFSRKDGFGFGRFFFNFDDFFGKSGNFGV